jgi:hypothetical protein
LRCFALKCGGLQCNAVRCIAVPCIALLMGGCVISSPISEIVALAHSWSKQRRTSQKAMTTMFRSKGSKFF